MYTEINGVALAIIAKAGTQSFTEASGAGWYLTNEQALEYPTRVFFIRNPFERLESCYSFFCGIRDEGASQSVIPVDQLESWEIFIDYILVNSDEHWNPQNTTLLYNGELTPTDILKFEILSPYLKQNLSKFEVWAAEPEPLYFGKIKDLEKRYSSLK